MRAERTEGAPLPSSGAVLDQDDDALLAELRGGNLDAFGELYSRHVASARRVARRAGAVDIDDAVHEAFIKVLRAVRAGSGPTQSFVGYLYTSVRRVATRQRQVELRRLRDETLCNVSSPFESPDLSRMTSAFASLAPRHRETLQILVIDGYPPRRACEQLETASAGAVASRGLRARAALRAAYHQQLVEA